MVSAATTTDRQQLSFSVNECMHMRRRKSGQAYLVSKQKLSMKFYRMQIERAILVAIISFFLVSCNFDVQPKGKYATGDEYILYKYETKIFNFGELLGTDIELFKRSSAWKMAIAVYEQDTLEIEKQHKLNSEAIYFQEQKYGMTLLCWAVINDRYFSAKTLLKLGSDPNRPMYNDGTPVNYACEKETTANYLRLLLLYNVDLSRKSRSISNYYVTLMEIAARTSLENVMVLENAGLYINYDTNHLRTPLSVALSNWHIEIAEYLILKGADYRKPVYFNETDTIYAIDEIKDGGYKTNSGKDSAAQRVLKFLREHGADSSQK